MKKMSDRDYYVYKSAIEVANKEEDKKGLAHIQKELVSEYGLENSDVIYLLKLFKYTV